MARRAKDWEENLSIDLRSSIEARKYFYLGLLEEKYDWREALLKIIKLIGVNEYAEMVGDMKPSNLLNQLKAESNPTLNTLVKIIRPLGIELTFKDKLEDVG